MIKSNSELQKEFEARSDREFFSRVKTYLDDIPVSNGSKYYASMPVKIGIIADTFLYDSFRDAADFICLNPEKWKDQIQDIEILLIVSAWTGIGEEWRGAGKPGSKQQKVIKKIIAECKNNGISTVFYSKEDPPNYTLFIDLAKECDYIFTSCAEVMDKYKNDCDNDNVDVLTFAINPLFHNPVGMRSVHKQDGVIFSGSWMIKYTQRCADMQMLFDGIIGEGIPFRIIDRNYDIGAEKYRYPAEYWEFVSPSVKHDDLQKIHKLYDVALNVNTVKDSQTMFANRGYELLASGNVLISNYSVGENNLLPYVYLVHSKQEVSEIIKHIDGETLYRRQIDGIRDVMTGDTCFDRVGKILAKVGKESILPERKVAVIADYDTEHIREMFKRQTYKSASIFFANEVKEEMLEEYDILAFFADGMEYDIFYLEDMINGFKYTACDFITKDAYMSGREYISGKEHDYVSNFDSKYRTVFWVNSFWQEENEGHTLSLHDLLELEGPCEISNGYSIDHFNYNAIKFEQAHSREVTGKKLSVIVPVYNNGRYLMAKCFASLMRSSIFQDMHVILVDDGSTDGVTRDIVAYLARNYANVTAFFFPEGGSGSASRPRNKGMELATTDYITFLDPDNEAINDAYARMYDKLSVNVDLKPIDLVIGNMLKCTDKVSIADYYRDFNAASWHNGIYEGDMIKLLVDANFNGVSMQAMLIRRKWLVKHKMHLVEGAIGEDTLFGWELIFNAQKIMAMNLPAHVYYAAVSSSVTNKIGRSFYIKQSLVEEPKRHFLERAGLLQEFMERRFNYYFTNWILDKLLRTKDEDLVECIKLVYSIYSQYADVYNHNSTVMNDFVRLCKQEQYLAALSVVKNKDASKLDVGPKPANHEINYGLTVLQQQRLHGKEAQERWRRQFFMECMNSKLVFWGVRGERSYFMRQRLSQMIRTGDWFIEDDKKNKITKQGKCPVLQPEALRNISGKYKIIIMNDKYQQVRERLLNYGYVENVDFAEARKLIGEDENGYIDLPCIEKAKSGMIVYGFGAHLSDMLDWYPNLSKKIVRIIDKDAKKIGTIAYNVGVKIESPKVLADLPSGTEIAISAIRYLDDISNEINLINPGLICQNIDNVIKEYLD